MVISGVKTKTEHYVATCSVFMVCLYRCRCNCKKVCEVKSGVSVSILRFGIGGAKFVGHVFWEVDSTDSSKKKKSFQWKLFTNLIEFVLHHCQPWVVVCSVKL